MGNPGREVTKKAPCPICSKTDWCYRLDDGIAINCKRADHPPEGWQEIGTAKEGKIFRPIEKLWTKPARPRQQREWVYQNADGKNIIKVCRTDDGQGNKKIWQKSLVKGKKPGQIQEKTRPYRYADCLERARQGQKIFWVEGEACADALWSIGIPATTTIRGSGAYHSEQYAKLFPKGSIIICPDRDEPGIRYASQVAQDYPDNQWVYAFPNSPLWINVRGTNGADIADWIEAGVTAEKIQAAIEPRRQLGASEKVKTIPPLADLNEAIKSLVAQSIDDSELTLRLQGLADEFNKSLQLVEKLFYQLRWEQETTEAAHSAASDLTNLQQIRQRGLSIEAGLHGDGGRLASLLRATAEAMPTAPEFLATTLIPVLASRIGTSATLVINARAGYTVRPIFRSLIVAATGRKKTPAQKAVLSSLTELESIHHQAYQTELEEYERELDAWKPGNDEPKPRPPTRKRYLSTDDTLAARIKAHTENPKGLLLYRDEGSAFITERGRFSNGKGDGGETEADLSEFNGGMLSRDRKVDGSVFLPKTGISRTGAIQYAKLQQLMGDHQDDCGEWARYLFCLAEAPPAYINLLNDDGDTGLQKTLINLVQRLDDLPEADYLLSHNAKLAFMEYQHLLTDRAISTDHPSLQAALPKFETYFGRFILLLHVVNAVLSGQQPTATVDAHTVELARQWTEYYYGQFQLLMALNSPQQELTGDLLRLRDYVERRPQRTIRQLVQAKFGKAAQVRTLVSTLVEQGHIVETDGTYSVVEPNVESIQQPSLPATTKVTAPPDTLTSKKSEAPSVTPPPPSASITIDSPVEVAYLSGEIPPPGAPLPGTRGIVTAISRDSITVFITPPPDTPDIPLGKRFKTVSRNHLKPLVATAS